jgi:tight adherence protein B
VKRAVWILGLFAIALTTAAAAALAAPSAPTDTFKLTAVGRLPFPERGYIVDLPRGAAVGHGQVHVTENALGVGDFTFDPLSSSGVSYGAILAVDASDSMAGKPVAAALAAARRFVAKRGANEQIGIVAFNGAVHVLQKPTADPGALSDALAQPPALAYATHIYDALGGSLQLLAKQKVSAGAIVLLSDGADVGSTTNLAAIVRRATTQHVRIFTVGLRSGAFDGSALRAIAAGTGGSYAEASSSEQLAGIYDALSSRLASEYLLQYRSAAAPKSSVDVSISIDGVGRANESYRAPTPSDLPPFHRSLGRRFLLSTFSLLLVSLFAAVILAFALRLLLESSKSHLVERVRAFAGEAKSAAAAEGLRRRADRATATSSRFARRRLDRLEEQLDIGRINATPTRIVVLTIAATVLAVLLLSALSPVFALLGLATPLLTRAYVRSKVKHVRDDFAEQLPPNLQVLASALRAGHSLVGALMSTVDNADEPSRAELGRAVADEQLGMPLDDAVRRVAKRMASRDLEQVALLAELQRTAGGNAAEVLDVIVGTVRERADIRRLVRTLTAQGRMARWILTALPIVTALGFWAVQPDIVGPMWHSGGGQVALAIASVMVGSGSMIIQRIVDIEI